MFSTTRVPNKTNIFLPQGQPTKQMFYYNKGTQITSVLLPQGHPPKQMFYYNKGTQLNKCFTTTRVTN